MAKNLFTNLTVFLFTVVAFCSGSSSFREQKVTELLRTEKWVLRKVLLVAKSKSRKGKSCRASVEILRAESLSTLPADLQALEKLKAQDEFTAPPKECDSFDTNTEIDRTLKVKLLGRQFLEVVTESSRIAFANEKNHDRSLYDLGTGERVTLKDFIKPNIAENLLKETYLDQDSENEGTGRVEQLFKKDPRCRDSQPRFLIDAKGHLEIELCPSPPFRGPVVKPARWQDYLVENALTLSLFSAR